ncbi:MAG: alpha/beta hydrolase [Lachnospiraceae bacterium]|nr:alpha/beta hydrolase [Lachnospiraceae bacterium]
MIRKLIINHIRKTFIKNCIRFDTPRLNSEQYPDEAKVEADILYDGTHKLDYYIPENCDPKEAYILIHGGAFVYGSKELDKCFGMHLAIASGRMVANVDYTLMPETDLAGQIGEIFAAIRYLTKDKGIETLHTIGDSAGGYLSILTGLLLHSPRMRADFGLGDDGLPAVGNIIAICTCYNATPKTFAGYYFDKAGKLPHYIYDLTEAMAAYGCPPLTLVTGDHDEMLPFNRELKQKADTLKVPVSYKEFNSAEDRIMHHVFPIAHPTWPESREVIDMCIRR